jgi:hypothetical protein
MGALFVILVILSFKLSLYYVIKLKDEVLDFEENVCN